MRAARGRCLRFWQCSYEPRGKRRIFHSNNKTKTPPRQTRLHDRAEIPASSKCTKWHSNHPRSRDKSIPYLSHTMKIFTPIALAAAIMLSVAHAAPAGDLVTQLPGWNAPLPMKIYSGYVDAGASEGYTMHEHYVFAECSAPCDPATAPVLVWPVRDSAEHFSRLNSLLFTATAWIFIPACCFAVP